MRRTTLRGLAGMVGVVCGAAAAWSVLLVGVVSSGAQAPNRYATDGDPCCWRPDTWGETALGSFSTLVASLIPGLLATLAAALLTWAVTARRARARRLAWIPAGALIGAVVLVAITLVSTLDDMRPAPDCDSVAIDDVRYGDDLDARLAAEGIVRCGLLIGKTRDGVRRSIGPTTTRSRFDGREHWYYGDLVLEFAGGRVLGATTQR